MRGLETKEVCAHHIDILHHDNLRPVSKGLDPSVMAIAGGVGSGLDGLTGQVVGRP